ncbi:MAG: ATP-binding cassette domain-containing protein, partial [Bacilli bacterium]
MKKKNKEIVDEKEEKIPDDVILRVSHLKMYFPISTGFLRNKDLKAVDDISFDIKRGETLGLVGESGCGKTTAGRAILHLYKPTSGRIWLNGKEIKTKQDLKEFRTKTNIVFQDPYSSLDPRKTVEDIIAEPLDIHKAYKNKEERHQKVMELMTTVGLTEEQANRYP